MKRQFFAWSKGFTLFTALVAFILILLSILLVQSMVSSERKTTDLISDIEEQTKMQSIAELNRTDALQAFNYLIRKRIEEWLVSGPSGSSNYYLMTPDKAQDWKLIVKDFAAYNFGGTVSGGRSATQLAEYIHNSIQSFFAQKSVPGYRVTLKTKDDSPTGRAKLKQALQNAIANSSSMGDFFKVIGCTPENDPEPETCTGTFYLNLDFSGITQEEYESLPVIEVESVSSGTVIQQPVLPRGKMQIYVPLRVFRALAWARKAACNTQNCNGPSDYGFFSARVHNEFEEMALGYCDQGICAPRTDPYSNPSSEGLVDPSGNKTCSDAGVELGCNPNVAGALAGTGACSSGSSGISYIAGNPSTAMSAFGKARLCAIAKSNYNQYVSPTFIASHFSTDFGLAGGTDCGGGLVGQLSATARDYSSKSLLPVQPFLGYSPRGISTGTRNFGACPVQGGGTGLFVGASGQNSYKAISRGSLACTGISGGASALSCSKIDATEVMLSFTDSNKLYMVDKTRNENNYAIKLYDNRFSGFTAKWSAPLAGNNSCLLAYEPREGSCSAGGGWSCVPLIKVGGTVIGSNESGCRPA